MPAARPTKAAICRAIDAWKSAGLVVGRLEISEDGRISIYAPVDTIAESQQPAGPKKWRTG